jgi:RNA polymerase sigma-70 factor, ECF subfamily
VRQLLLTLTLTFSTEMLYAADAYPIQARPRRYRCDYPIRMDDLMTQPRLPNDEAVSNRSSKEMSDEWLVVAARDGNVDAFAALRDRHFRRILRTTYRITKNWEDAEDALQDAFLKAFTHLNEFEGRCSFSSWVTRIAINMALMILRKKRVIKELSIDAGDNDCVLDDGWQLRDLREDPERCYSRRERANLLKRAIRGLRPNLRTALELQQAQEHSIREIADSLGISSAAVKGRLSRARLSLRTVLRDNNLSSYQIEGKRSIG